jgi:hypothetical protein
LIPHLFVMVLLHTSSVPLLFVCPSIYLLMRMDKVIYFFLNAKELIQVFIEWACWVRRNSWLPSPSFRMYVIAEAVLLSIPGFC